MNHPFINRWSPAVVVLRWRHLFWSLPLLALLIGGATEWRNYQLGIQARGVIQRENSATISMPEIRDLILSEALLREAAFDSGLVKDWNTGSAEKLRDLVRCEEIKGTTLLAITVRGRNTPTKADFCDRLPILAMRESAEMRDQEIKKAEAALAALNEAHKENGRRYRQHVQVGLEAPQKPFVPTPEYLETKQRLEESDKTLDAARTAYIDLRLQGVVSGAPITIIDKAATPVAFSPVELVAPSARASCWIGGSVLFAVLLAYLLEWSRRNPPPDIRKSRWQRSEPETSPGPTAIPSEQAPSW